MALYIPDFEGQSQRALQTGLGLGQAIRQKGLTSLKEQQMQQQLQAGQLGMEQQIQQMRAGELGIQQAQGKISAQQDQMERIAFVDALNMAIATTDDNKRANVYADLKRQFGQKPGVAEFLDDMAGKSYNEQIQSVYTLNQALSGKIGKSDKTTVEKNWEKYQSIENPEDKKAFGLAANFTNSGQQKRLFKVTTNDDGSVTKYFSDGTEESTSPKEKVKTPDMEKSMSVEKAQGIVDKAKEGQLKNAGFAITLADGLAQMNALESKGFDPSSVGWIQKYLAGTTAGSIAMNPDEQMFVGAVEQMINAIARRETGAAITAFEKEDFFNRYMPVAGDSKERLKQKKSALERQFKSIRGQSGSVYDAIRITQNMGNGDISVSAEQTTPQTSQYQEGQTATNPTTGERVVYRNGQWVKL